MGGWGGEVPCGGDGVMKLVFGGFRQRRIEEEKGLSPALLQSALTRAELLVPQPFRN